jgi:hypothetical protein
MSKFKLQLSPDDYLELLDETDLILNIGNEPELNLNKNRFGLEFETKDVEWLQKNVKALAKAHLYLHSLKPKFAEIEKYLRWHPNAADAKAYKAALHMYQLRMDEVRSDLKDKKEFFLPTAKESLEWSKQAKQRYETVDIPTAKLLLQLLDKEKESADAQAELAAEIEARNKELYNQARKMQNKQLRNAGFEPSTNNTNQNTLANNLSKQMKEEAEKAWENQRQNLVNIIEGKQKSQKNMLREALGPDADKYNLNSMNQVNNSLTKQMQANYKAHLNEIRAKKQKRLLAKQSQSRKARKTRKNSRSTRRT